MKIEKLQSGATVKMNKEEFALFCAWAETALPSAEYHGGTEESPPGAPFPQPPTWEEFDAGLAIDPERVAGAGAFVLRSPTSSRYLVAREGGLTAFSTITLATRFTLEQAQAVADSRGKLQVINAEIAALPPQTTIRGGEQVSTAKPPAAPKAPKIDPATFFAAFRARMGGALGRP